MSAPLQRLPNLSADRCEAFEFCLMVVRSRTVRYQRPLAIVWQRVDEACAVVHRSLKVCEVDDRARPQCCYERLHRQNPSSVDVHRHSKLIRSGLNAIRSFEHVAAEKPPADASQQDVARCFNSLHLAHKMLFQHPLVSRRSPVCNPRRTGHRNRGACYRAEERAGLFVQDPRKEGKPKREPDRYSERKCEQDGDGRMLVDSFRGSVPYPSRPGPKFCCVHVLYARRRRCAESYLRRCPLGTGGAR